MRTDKDRLLDIQEAIDRIEGQKNITRSEFDKNQLLQIWCLHYLQIIGEAANRISEGMRAKHNEIPWGKLIGMRHILVHGYFEIDLDIVWNTIHVDLPGLKEQVNKIIKDIKVIE